MQLPADRKIIDFSRDSLEQNIDKVFGSDPKYAPIRKQASDMAKQGLIKLLAFETATISTGFTTNCNVLVQENWGNPTIEQVADATVKQTAPLVASGTQPKLEYIMIKSGKLAVIRSIITPPNPSVPTLVSIEYLSIHGGKASAISFTAPVTDETHIRAIGDQAMQDFHFTN